MSLRSMMCAVAASALLAFPAQAQLAVVDPADLVQTSLTAARTLEQVNNQIQSLRNEARNLQALGARFAPQVLARVQEMNALIEEARGLAMTLQDTRSALEDLYDGDYANTDIASRARRAARQLDASRAALQRSLLMQAEAVEKLRGDEAQLSDLAGASQSASGALSVQQATNEYLGFQSEQLMRLSALVAAQSRAEALERARELEVRAAARAQHEAFFAGANAAHPGRQPGTDA